MKVGPGPGEGGFVEKNLSASGCSGEIESQRGQSGGINERSH